LAVFLVAFSISALTGFIFYVGGLVAHGNGWIAGLDTSTFAAFMAFVFSLLPALLMSIVEWPKAKRLIQQPDGGLWQQCWMSVIAASVLPAVITIIGWAVTESGSSGDAQEWVGMVSAVPAFMLGGLVSAVIWWFVVIQYGRRIFNQNASGVISD
jgi:magnesium-transporting ATPase (P-type)